MTTKQNVSTIHDDFANGKWYTNVHRIKELPKLVLSSRVGYRQELFQSKLLKSSLTLVLYPGGYDHDHSDYVAIRASLSEQVQYKVIVDIALCGHRNEEQFRKRIVLTKENYDRAVVKDFIGKSILLKTAQLLHNGDQLQILCRVFECEPAFNTSRLVSKYRHSQTDNYEKLFENPNFSDFQVAVGDDIFKVHKCILATQSPVFTAMFLNDMSEKEQASTTIEDVDAETMKQMLRFIYIGNVENLNELATKLWIVADKYDVKLLKEMCEEKMIEQLSVDTICKTLCFLDKYNTRKLKLAAIQVIFSNVDKISDNTKFQSTLKTLSSDLLSEVLVLMCISLKKSRTRLRSRDCM